MAAVTICSDFGGQKNKVWHCFPIYFPWSNGTGCHDLSFLNVELAIKLGRLTVQNGSTDSQVSQFLASSATCWHSWCFLRESWRKDPQGMVSAATGAFPPYSLTGAGYSQEARLWDWLLQFVTESKLALLSALQANESKRWAVETRNMTVFRKQADKVDNWIMSQHYHLTGLWVGARFFYRTRRRSDEELIPNQGLTSRALYS